jgi:hypothetical protein
VLWRAVVAGLAGRGDAARALLTELAGVAPQFVEVGRRFGVAGPVPEDLIERIMPASAAPAPDAAGGGPAHDPADDGAAPAAAPSADPATAAV